jgi:hypothetical protein
LDDVVEEEGMVELWRRVRMLVVWVSVWRVWERDVRSLCAVWTLAEC